MGHLPAIAARALVPFASGALVAGYLVAALFFLRFWRDSRERLFAWFSAAFLLLAAQRVLLVVIEPSVAIYVARVVAFVLIFWAIIEKNRGA